MIKISIPSVSRKRSLQVISFIFYIKVAVGYIRLFYILNPHNFIYWINVKETKQAQITFKRFTRKRKKQEQLFSKERSNWPQYSLLYLFTQLKQRRHSQLLTEESIEIIQQVSFPLCRNISFFRDNFNQNDPSQLPFMSSLREEQPFNPQTYASIKKDQRLSLYADLLKLHSKILQIK